MVEDLITSSIRQQKQQEKRIGQRIELNRSVQVKFADGQIINGLTDNVSLGGLKIITRDNFANNILSDASGKMIMLQIKFVDGHLSDEYPCSIARHETSAICFKLDKKKAASFGSTLRQSVF